MEVTASATTPTAFEIRTLGRAHRRDRADGRMSLRATEDGWSLVAPDGTVVFRGLGLAGRRQCLQYAREHGVLCVYS